MHSIYRLYLWLLLNNNHLITLLVLFAPAAATFVLDFDSLWLFSFSLIFSFSLTGLVNLLVELVLQCCMLSSALLVIPACTCLGVACTCCSLVCERSVKRSDQHRLRCCVCTHIKHKFGCTAMHTGIAASTRLLLTMQYHNVT
jgi:hypothetical protein